MMHQSWAALALLGLNAIGVMGDGVCVPGCSSTVQGRFAEFDCHDASQNGCLCLKQEFVDGVAKCAFDDCGANVDEVRVGLVGDHVTPRFCFPQAGQVPAARAQESPSASPSPSPSPSTSTAEQSTSSPSPTPTSTSTPPPTSTSQSTPVSTSTTLATTTSSAATTSGTSTESAAATSSHSSTSTTAAGESSPTSSPVPASGISSGASAGIGIGVAVVVVAAAIIAFCMLKKRKNKAAPRQSMDISKPLPGSGRTYPTRDQQHHDHGRDSYEHKYDNDIEMTSNRYEDMVESQQPRTMV